MEAQYLKPTFKSERSTLGIWGAIAWGKKRPVHFLIKDGQMTSEIYVNNVLKPLRFLFFEAMIEKRENMIWMDDGATYHTSKLTIKFCQEVGLLCMKWLT